MDLSIARSRIASVIKPDSITASQGDFLGKSIFRLKVGRNNDKVGYLNI